VILATSDTGSVITVQASLDTSIVQTRTREQGGESLLCPSESGSNTEYACMMAPTLTGYEYGMVLRWVPDVSSMGAVTLNVDTLGSIPVKEEDSTTDASVIAGRMYWIWYDGSVFRVR
jgi:hypothetical protein